MAERISRRTFVRAGAVAVALSAVPLGWLTRAIAAPAAPWARSRFAPFQGATFQMTDGTNSADVVLTELRDLKPVLRPADEKRFLLLFAAAGSDAPADGIRTFRNKGFGEIDMFVSPAGWSAESLTYQVIINRL